MGYAAGMRAVLVLVLVGCAAGCSDGGGDAFPPDPDPGDWDDPGNAPRGCVSDEACPTGEVCARAGGCMAADLVRAGRVNWTLSGRPADRTTCGAAPELRIKFAPGADQLGLNYAPVPCTLGRFTVDKLPITYTEVKLGLSHGGDEQSGTLDAVTGELTIDLPF
jgi:hypothetical protein